MYYTFIYLHIYRKANNTPQYINAFSNHPLTIIKQLPKVIDKKISDLSCNKKEFDKVKSIYESVLSTKDSGYFSSMSYNNSNSQNARRNRNRKIIWFNHHLAKM